MEHPAENLRDRIAMLCRHRNITLKQLAQKIKLSEQTFYNIIRKETGRLHQYRKMADALDCTLFELMGIKDYTYEKYRKTEEGQMHEMRKNLLELKIKECTFLESVIENQENRINELHEIITLLKEKLAMQEKHQPREKNNDGSSRDYSKKKDAQMSA